MKQLKKEMATVPANICQDKIYKKKNLLTNFNVNFWNKIFPNEKLNKIERKRSLWQYYECIGCTKRYVDMCSQNVVNISFFSSNNKRILFQVYSSNKYAWGEKMQTAKNKTISKFKFTSTRAICIFHLVQEGL